MHECASQPLPHGFEEGRGRHVIGDIGRVEHVAQDGTLARVHPRGGDGDERNLMHEGIRQLKARRRAFG